MFLTVLSALQFLWLPFFIFTDFPVVENYDYEKDSMAPVVFVPGIGGTQIEGKWNTDGGPDLCFSRSFGWRSLWLKLDIAQSHILKCWAHRFPLIYDRTTHKCKNQEGVETRVPHKFGSCKPVEYLTSSILQTSKFDYFHAMIQACRDKGYSTDQNLKAAGYDWRFAILQQKDFGYFDQLAQLIERIADDSKRKVAIVSHGMGGLMAAYFLMNRSQSWKDKYIHTLVTINTPWLGSPHALKNYLTGTSFGLPFVERSTMKDVAKTLQSVAFLLPAEESYEDTILIDWPSKDKKYTAKDYEEFFRDINYEDAYLMRQDLRSLFPFDLDKLGVPATCIYSTTIEDRTIRKYIIEGDLDAPESIKPIFGEGDGMVPLKSLRYCVKFKDVTVKTFLGYKHTEILEKDAVIDYVMSLLEHVKDLP